MIADYDLKREIARELGTEVLPSEWQWLDSQGILSQRRTGQITSAGVVEKIRQGRRAFGTNSPKPPSLERDRGGKTSGSRLQALSQIVARYAGDDPGVQKFRKEILKEGLLPRDKIEEWIKGQAQEDGPHTIFLKVPLPRTHKLLFGADGLFPSEPLTVSQDWPAYETQLESLFYPGSDDFVRSVSVSMDGVLNDLRYLSETLAERYGWQPGQATEFILTGTTPAIVPFELGFKMRMSNPSLSRVTLTLDPALSPQEVAEYYRQYRRQVLGSRYRSLSEKHITLALFKSSRPAEETNAEAMKAWNKEYRKWRYRQETNFGRDAQVALRRLLSPGQVGWSWLGAKPPEDPDELEYMKALGETAVKVMNERRGV
jgi:hypothetical protein